jgi:hypothetical protein
VTSRRDRRRTTRATALSSVAALLLVARLAGASPSPGAFRAVRLADHRVDASAAGSAVLAVGGAPDEGSLAGAGVDQPVVDMAATPTGHGYWLAAADGGIFSFGDANFYGSAGGQQLAQEVVAIAATP